MIRTDLTGPGAVCRNCGNTGYDMFQQPCVCAYGREAAKAARPIIMASEPPVLRDTTQATQQDTPYPWRTCPHGEAVRWNPFNQVVQCHRCGWVFTPAPEPEPEPEQTESDSERLKREVREAALVEVQEFVVAHTFDTTVGHRIDDFISGLLDADKTE